MADGHPVFLQGSCSQFVEHVYRCLGWPLVTLPGETGADPIRNERIPPSLILLAFWRGEYPLSVHDLELGLHGPRTPNR